MIGRYPARNQVAQAICRMNFIAALTLNQHGSSASSRTRASIVNIRFCSTNRMWLFVGAASLFISRPTRLRDNIDSKGINPGDERTKNYSWQDTSTLTFDPSNKEIGGLTFIAVSRSYLILEYEVRLVWSSGPFLTQICFFSLHIKRQVYSKHGLFPAIPTR